MNRNDQELIISRNDIDFSGFTVDRLKRVILKNIQRIAHMVCETQDTFRRLVEHGEVQIGEVSLPGGRTFIFLNFQGQNIVVPYKKIH